MARDLVRVSDYLHEHPNRFFTLKVLAKAAVGYDRQPYIRIVRKGVPSISKRMERNQREGVLLRQHTDDKMTKPVLAIAWAIPSANGFDNIHRLWVVERRRREKRGEYYSAGDIRMVKVIKALPAYRQKQLELFERRLEDDDHLLPSSEK